MVVVAAPVALAGFVALIWLVATEPIWWPALENLSASLGPVVGAAVRQFLSTVKSAMDSAAHWADSTAGGAVTLSWGLYWSAYQRTTAVPGALNQAWQAINRVQTQIVPHAVNTETQARVLADDNLWKSTVGLAESTEAKAATATAAEATARTTADDNLWKSTVGLAEQTQAKAQALVSGEELTRAAGDARLQQLLDISFQQAEADTSTQISAEASQRAAGEARLQANIDLGDLSTRQLLEGELSRTASGILAQLGTVAATAAAASAVAEGEISQIRNLDCIKFCNILGGIGSLLSGLELAGLLALLAEAYQNPEGAAQLLNQDLVQPAEQALGDVLGLFGIKAA